MNVPLLDLQAQYASISEQVDAAIQRVVSSQQFILGPEVEALEGEIARYCGCQYAIGVSSGSDALLVALMAIGVQPGDEVITSAYSFFATAGAVARLGARSVFVDVSAEDCNIDPGLVEAAITERTRAILPVHLFGQVADMDPLLDLGRAHGLYVIEDAAQAIGAEYRGRRAGSMGHVGCLSFFPSKNLGGFGDSGMVVTNDAQLAERVRLLRSHGAQPKYHHKEIGGNFRMDALQAAVLRVKFGHLERWTECRRQNARAYQRLLAGAELRLPSELAERRHVYNQFVVQTPRRDALRRHLHDAEIGSEIYYPEPLHTQPCFQDLGYVAGEFPVSERATRETVALPIYPELTADQLQRVSDSVRAGVALEVGAAG